MAKTGLRNLKRAAEAGESTDAPAGYRYKEIKNYILDALKAGELRVGDRVPSESELVARFGVSRMTANRALRELTVAGALVRRPGDGTYIAETKPIGHLIEIRNIADEVRSRGHAYRPRVLLNERLKADVGSAALLNVQPGTPLFHSIIVHHEAEFPLQLEERYVLAAAAPSYGDEDFTEVTPNELLTRVAPIEKVEHRVCARMPDSDMRSLLGMQTEQPVLVMTRRTWSGGRLVSHAILTHPAERYELTASFEVGHTR